MNSSTEANGSIGNHNANKELESRLEEEQTKQQIGIDLPSEVVGSQRTRKADKPKGPLKVLFLTADTGGGHRASAEALAKQFVELHPGVTYDFLDIWSADGKQPYDCLVSSYKHLSDNPWQWQILYHVSNLTIAEYAVEWHSTSLCEEDIRYRLASYDPDIIVSVHPTMNYAPAVALENLTKDRIKPCMVTVVTDLGSAHNTWFQQDVDRIYVASEALEKLALRRNPEVKRIGLPIRQDFQDASKLGSSATKQKLGISTAQPMVLVMNGGEGNGNLFDIVSHLYDTLALESINTTICVVCGRNDALRTELEQHQWKAQPSRQRQQSWLDFFSRPPQEHNSAPSAAVSVQVLGFVKNMAEYMVAADILVSKAGPGTIAEAAAVGLPVLLTSFLPGQEAGNVDFVVEQGFGDYRTDAMEIAHAVSRWLKDAELLDDMGAKALRAGNPSAAKEIVLDILALATTATDPK